tara:strand:+ start:2964 stop:3209 length:246 start_codon:yes stop_codon:yes gene_type:complete
LVICFLPYCWVFGEFILQTFQLCAADFHEQMQIRRNKGANAIEIQDLSSGAFPDFFRRINQLRIWNTFCVFAVKKGYFFIF